MITVLGMMKSRDDACETIMHKWYLFGRQIVANRTAFLWFPHAYL